MDTSSPTSLARCAAKSSLCRSLSLALGLVVAAPVTAQNLELKVSDGVTPWTSSLSPQQSYLLMLGTCDPSFVNGWYGAIAFAYQEFNPETDYPLVTTSLSSVVNPLINDTIPNTDVVESDSDTLLEFFEHALLTPGTANLSDVAVRNQLDPLFLPEGFNADGQPQIQQLVGYNTGFPWRRDPSLQYIFNSDSVLMDAVWRRAEPKTQLSRYQFFNAGDGGFGQMLDEGITLSVTLIGVRGPNSTIFGFPFPWPIAGVPGLTGFPALGLPQLAISNTARIRFGGSNLPFDWGLRFSPNLNLSGAGSAAPSNVMSIGSPGSGFRQAATGFRPGMQIRLFQNGAQGVSYTLDLFSLGNGEVAFRIPTACATATHSVRKFRYYIGELNGVAQYGPWHTIPQGQRAIIAIQ